MKATYVTCTAEIIGIQTHEARRKDRVSILILIMQFEFKLLTTQLSQVNRFDLKGKISEKLGIFFLSMSKTTIKLFAVKLVMFTKVFTRVSDVFKCYRV